MSKLHTLAMDLTPRGENSCVLLDGVDISGLLRSVVIRAAVGELTTIELGLGPNQLSQIMLTLPEAQITLLAQEEKPNGTTT